MNTKFLIAASLIALAPCGMSAEQYRVKAVKSDYNYKANTYEYNSMGKVASDHKAEYGEDLGTHMYEYDIHGNLIADEYYQQFYDSNRQPYEKFVNQITYTYDDQNRMETRTAWNNWTDGEDPNDFEFGSQAWYEYDEEGKLVEVKWYWEPNKKDYFMRDTYEYDVLGRLYKKCSYIWKWNFDNLSSEQEYVYNEDGTLQMESRLSYNIMNGEYSGWLGLLYFYDEEKNLTEFQQMTQSGALNNKWVFKYNDGPASEVTFPYSPETEGIYDLYMKMTKRPKSYDIYLPEEDSGNLIYHDTLAFGYYKVETGGDGVSTNPAAMRGLSVSSVNSDRLVLDGVEAGMQVTIFNNEGACVNADTYNGPIQISELPSGVYVVLSSTGAAKFVK